MTRLRLAFNAHQHGQHIFQHVLGDLAEFFFRPVLYGMRRPDDTGLETERFGLKFRRITEFGRHHEAAGNAAVVEILDVMQTARRARASIGQRGNHQISFGGHRLEGLDRRGFGIGRFGVARGPDTALGQ